MLWSRSTLFKIGDLGVIAIGEFGRRGAIGVTDRGEGAKLSKITNQIAAPIAATDRRHPHRAVCVPVSHRTVVIVQSEVPRSYRKSG
jgi:hypothetical protein